MPRKNIYVFPVSQPTLIFSSDPKVFIAVPKNEIQLYMAYLIFRHLLSVLQLSLPCFSIVVQ